MLNLHAEFSCILRDHRGQIKAKATARFESDQTTKKNATFCSLLKAGNKS